MAPSRPLPRTTQTWTTDSSIGEPGSQGERQLLWPHSDHRVRTCLVTWCPGSPCVITVWDALLSYPRARGWGKGSWAGVWSTSATWLPPDHLVQGRPTTQGVPLAVQQEAHGLAQLSPLHPGQPVTSASSVLWEICLSSSRGLCPENLRGWSGHFQAYFLSTGEQAAQTTGSFPSSPCQAMQCAACGAVPDRKSVV